MRTRFSLGPLLALVLVFSAILPAFAPTALAAGPAGLAQQTAAADRALSWLLTQQQDDGSFPTAFGSPSGMTIDALLAGISAGADVSTWHKAPGRPTALDYLATHAASYAVSAAASGKLLVGIAAAGLDGRSFAGLDLVARTISYTLAMTEPSANDVSWGILGLAAAREPLPGGSPEALLALQRADGGWGGSWGSDVDTTAIALQALASAGITPTAQAVISATDYMRLNQAASGGFISWGAVASPNTTAYAIQALIAVQQNPLSPAWLKDGHNALDDLLSFQLPSGGFGTGTADVLTTVQAVPALLGKPLPFASLVAACHDALAYLKTLQQPNGGFDSTIGSSSQAMMALAALGISPRDWKGASGQSLLDFCRAAAPSITGTGAAGRLAAALAMAGENPYLAGGKDLIALVKAGYNPTTGAYDANGDIYRHCLAVWGLLSAGESVPGLALTWLKAQQNADGGWGWAAGQKSDSNSTASAIQALVGAGTPPADPTIARAIAYLHTQQTGDGGFAWDTTTSWSATTDANSTAVTIQGLLAAGQDPTRGWGWAQELTATTNITMTVWKPMERLLSFQEASGAFDWQPGAGLKFLATAQALPAVAGKPFPIRSTTIVAARKALDWARTQQRPDGSFPTSFGSPASMTIDAVLAGVALGEDISTWVTGTHGVTPMDYLATQVISYATTTPATAKLLLAVVGTRDDPTTFGGQNLAAMLLARDDGAGSFGASATDQAWAILGLAAMRRPMRSTIVEKLIAYQQPSGGFEWSAGGGTDSNTTAVAIEALIAARTQANAAAVDAAIASALAYMKTQQSASGGFTYSSTWGTDADANSTAYGLQALAAAGENPAGEHWSVSGANPTTDLLAMQLASGAFKGGDGKANLSATVQAVPGLLRSPLPLRTAHTGAIWFPVVLRSKPAQ